MLLRVGFTLHMLCIVSRYFSDRQSVAIMLKEGRQGICKGSEKEDCKLANMDVNNA